MVWKVLHLLIDDKNEVIQQFFFCTKCESILYSPRTSGCTTQLLRHPCIEPVQNSDMKITPADNEQLKIAAAKFICLDLRPFYAIECPGLRELICTGFELGKKYPTMTKEDFLNNLPSRYTVQGLITDQAGLSKNQIKIFFKEAIEQGGLGCTLDLMSDKHKSNSYMAMTANVFLLRDTSIEHKRVVFHMGLVANIVKSREVIKSRIIEVFSEFEVSSDEIRDKVTFTTDR